MLKKWKARCKMIKIPEACVVNSVNVLLEFCNKSIPDNGIHDNIHELKKCRNCLKKTKFDSYKCPYCGQVNFQYN